jgi:hypothetical protein
MPTNERKRLFTESQPKAQRIVSGGELELLCDHPPLAVVPQDCVVQQRAMSVGHRETGIDSTGRAGK